MQADGYDDIKYVPFQRNLSTGVQRLKPNRLKHVPLHRKLTAYIDCPFGKLNINISQEGNLPVAKARRHSFYATDTCPAGYP